MDMLLLTTKRPRASASASARVRRHSLGGLAPPAQGLAGVLPIVVMGRGHAKRALFGGVAPVVLPVNLLTCRHGAVIALMMSSHNTTKFHCQWYILLARETALCV